MENQFGVQRNDELHENEDQMNREDILDAEIRALREEVPNILYQTESLHWETMKELENFSSSTINKARCNNSCINSRSTGWCQRGHEVRKIGKSRRSNRKCRQSD